jgi:homoserine kinase
MHPLIGREIVVHGSTSNLAAGFDAVGLALDVALRLRITDVVEDGAGRLACRFATGPLRGSNAIERGYQHAVQVVGAGRPPSIDVDVDSDIPMRAGLGSSAAALVAGLRLAAMVTTPLPVTRLLTAACELEGHPDNTSASVLGGFVVACRRDDGSVVARATPWPAHWVLVVATPTLELETRVARAALPSQVPFSDAVFNLQRAALLVDAVHRQDAEAAACALDDRLHQQQRAALVPGLREALRWSAEGLIGTFLSGAGPSIAAVVDAGRPQTLARVHAQFTGLFGRMGLPVAVRTLRAVPPSPGATRG